MRLAVVMLVAAAGCGQPLTVTHVLTGPALAPKADRVAIPIFFDEQPPQPYREVAQIRVRAHGSAANLDAVLAAATTDARRIGADAIVVDLRAHYHTVDVAIDCEGRPHVPPTDRLNARVTAIVFVPEAAPEPAPGGPPPRRAPRPCP